MSRWDRIRDLPVRIDGYVLEGLSLEVSSGFERLSTVVRLRGGGEEGIGEDVTYAPDDQRAFRDAGPTLAIEGERTLEELSSLLDRLDPFPREPVHAAARDYRRWAFESAALDLGLRQAGLTLTEALGLELRPLHFVLSLRLGEPPSADGIRAWRELYPSLRLKLDPTTSWDDALIAELVELDAVDCLDFKGAYRGTPVDQSPDPALYRRVADAFPGAWLEDPALEPGTIAALEPHIDRVTWDAPIHSVADVEALTHAPRSINVKPSRFGSWKRLLEAYAYFDARGIQVYGGGQFELGPGRGQIQYLAAMFHPDTPNDVAPGRYNEPEPVAGLPSSPLVVAPDNTGFRTKED